MRTCAAFFFFLLAIVAVSSAQLDRAALEPPTYIRKFQSNTDVMQPTRLQKFAFRVSGYATNEDSVPADRAWKVDPAKYPDEIRPDSPHVVWSTAQLPRTPALASFGSALALPFSSHDLFMALPSKVANDGPDRVIVSDPTARAVHVFDSALQRYFRIQGGQGMRLQSPSAVAVDSQHNIYVGDDERGMILVYDRFGVFQRYIGARDGQEGGIFYRPSSIAIEPSRNRIYVADTTRHMIIVLDIDGKQLEYFGRPDLKSIRLRQRDNGLHEAGKMQLPTDLAIHGDELFVLGSSRVQVFDLNGNFRREFPVQPNPIFSSSGGMAVDTQSHVYVSDNIRGVVDVYDREGHHLASFGKPGSRHGEFSCPRGLWIDQQNRLYVADSGNGRVQLFQVHAERREVAQKDTLSATHASGE